MVSFSCEFVALILDMGPIMYRRRWSPFYYLRPGKTIPYLSDVYYFFWEEAGPEVVGRMCTLTGETGSQMFGP
jgi:hypothetical protein